MVTFIILCFGISVAIDIANPAPEEEAKASKMIMPHIMVP